MADPAGPGPALSLVHRLPHRYHDTFYADRRPYLEAEVAFIRASLWAEARDPLQRNKTGRASGEHQSAARSFFVHRPHQLKA